jgi:hypothetical protein
VLSLRVRVGRVQCEEAETVGVGWFVGDVLARGRRYFSLVEVRQEVRSSFIASVKQLCLLIRVSARSMFPV